MVDKLDLDDDDLDILDDDLPAYTPPGGLFSAMVPKAPQAPPEEEGDYRKIARNGSFEIEEVEGEDGAKWLSIDGGFMIVKEKIGAGAFC